MIDFTAYSHPVLAVSCTQCEAKVGSMCKRPSEHVAMDFHKSRKLDADKVFIEQHGRGASIERTDTGWMIDPSGYNKNKTQLDMGF